MCCLSNKHFVASSIKDVFDNIEAQKIINFMKETHFYKRLQCFHINVNLHFLRSLRRTSRDRNDYWLHLR